jgi:hypothetical protein
VPVVADGTGQLQPADRSIGMACPHQHVLSVVVRALLLLLLIPSSIGVNDRHIKLSIAINLSRQEPLSSEIDVRGTQK